MLVGTVLPTSLAWHLYSGLLDSGGETYRNEAAVATLGGLGVSGVEIRTSGFGLWT